METGKPAQTRPALLAGVAMAAFALAGPVIFALSWWRGESLFVVKGSYVIGAIVLFGLSIIALVGQRIVQRMAGATAGLALAGLVQVVGLLIPVAQPFAFKLSFMWYLNLLYGFPTFRGLGKATAWIRRKLELSQLDRPGRIAVLNGVLTLLWLVIMLCIGWRVYHDRLSGLIVGLWPRGWPTRALVYAVIAMLVVPIIYWHTGSRRPRANPRDASLEGRLRRLAIAAMAVAVVLAGAALAPAPAWAEMPADRILLTVETGPVLVGTTTLARGDRWYLSPTDTILVNEGGWARLTFRGGANAVLCAGSLLAIGPQWTDTARPIVSHVRLSLTRGRILADTASHTPGFGPLALTIDSRGEVSVNDGAAQYSIRPGGGEVAAGKVQRVGQWLPPSGNAVTCAGAQSGPANPTPAASAS